MADPVPNRIDALLERLQRQGQLEALDTELRKFELRELNEAEKKAWHHLYGISAFRRGDHAAAFERFREGHARCPNSAEIAFSLGQEHEFRGEIAPMLALFDAFRFPRVSSAYALAQARYAYLWGELPKAIGYMLPVLDAHFELRIADDNFLYMRGMPFFGQTWSTLAAFYVLQKDFGKIQQITDKAARSLSDFDGEEFGLFLQEYIKHDFNRTIALLKKLHGRPSGYHAMRAATFTAIQESEPSRAEALIAAVRLSRNDFPWLEDMRILVRLELAHRKGNPAQEAQFQTQFFKNQPLLFEPEHAFQFGILAVQERLKLIYQKNRRKS